MTRTVASIGELRTDLLELFENLTDLDVICAAPGTLPGAFAGQADIARSPTARLSTRTSHAWRGAVLDFLGVQLDALPQTARWEGTIRGWAARLREGRTRVFHQIRYADHTRIVSEPDRSLLFFGPLLGGDPRSPRFELTGAAHERARAWLVSERDSAEDISADVATLLEGSWAYGCVTPSDLYYKVLAEYFGSTLSGLDRQTDDNPLLESLTSFQQDAYHYSKGILRRYGGVFLSDVVGLGKTWIAMALLKHLQDQYDHHAVVLAPPAICPAWVELAHEHRVELVTVSTGKLDDLSRYDDREILVVDESHHFRNLGTQRYDALQRWLRPNGEPSARQVLLLSATPQNNDPQDILNQLRLMPDNHNRLPFRGESLDDWLRAVRSGREDPRNLLQHVVVRRTRSFVKNSYPDARLRHEQPDGTVTWAPLRFPRRLSGAAQCLRYTLDDGDPGGGVYDRVLWALEAMTYPLYGLGAFVLPAHSAEPAVADLRRAGASLRGLYKSLLLKRLESSLHAFASTIGRLHARLDAALAALDAGWVHLVAAEADRADEEAQNVLDGRLPARWFDERALRAALSDDRQQLERLLALVRNLLTRSDPKLTRLVRWFQERPPERHRTLLFTQFAETADWLAEQLGQRHGRTQVVTGAHGTKLSVARRFAPRANRVDIPADQQLDLLVATDVLSEGVNLQDADTIINYDLHWNPVRLIQRAGRIDRIGSEHEEIVVASFLPERGLEAGLGIEEVLRRRIAEFMAIFGEDSAVLPSDDRPDEARMVAAYTGRALEDADATDEMDGLSRHVNRILALRQEDQRAFERVSQLRNGRRAWSAGTRAAVAACRVGWFWTFFIDRPEGLVEVDDLSGLDRMWAHVQDGAGAEPSSHRASEVAEQARSQFAPTARQFVQQREHPKLSGVEQFVLDRLREYRVGALATQRPLVEAIEQWVRAGTAKAIVQREARKWKRSKLPPYAVFHESRVWYRRYPGQDEEIGEPDLIGLVLPGTS